MKLEIESPEGFTMVVQGYNQPSQMLYNIISPTETSFSIRSR